jgi:hypothetical protein
MPFFSDVWKWEETLIQGIPVLVRWTNCNRKFEASAVVERVNRASIRVILTKEPLGADGYKTGQSIVVPKTHSGGWSWNNCCLPVEEVN